MADFEFDVDAIEEAIKQYREAITEIDGIKRSLKEKLEVLKSSSWQSKGGEAFLKNLNLTGQMKPINT